MAQSAAEIESRAKIEITIGMKLNYVYHIRRPKGHRQMHFA